MEKFKRPLQSSEPSYPFPREAVNDPSHLAHLEESFFCSKPSLWPGSPAFGGIARKKHRREKNSTRSSPPCFRKMRRAHRAPNVIFMIITVKLECNKWNLNKKIFHSVHKFTKKIASRYIFSLKSLLPSPEIQSPNISSPTMKGGRI